MGTVLKASSLDRSTPTFCKLKTKKTLKQGPCGQLQFHLTQLLHKAKGERVLMLISSKRVLNHKERSQAVSRSQKPGAGLVPSKSRSVQFLKAAALLPVTKQLQDTHHRSSLVGQSASVHHTQVTRLWGFKTFFPLTTVFNHSSSLYAFRVRKTRTAPQKP